MSLAPRLTNFYPVEGVHTLSTLTPEIAFSWSVDIVTTQFSDPVNLQKFAQLSNDSTSEVIPLQFVSYSASNREIKLKPSTPLASDSTYRFFLNKGVVSTDSRKSSSTYTWKFKTNSLAISKVSLLGPANSSISESLPLLSWSSAGTGLINYLVEIDNNFKFTAPVYSSVTTGTSLLPVGSFETSKTYYWRVKAYTNAVTGAAWSEPWSFFFGSAQQAHPSTNQTFDPQFTFGISSCSLASNLSNRGSWPEIKVLFNVAIPSGAVDYLVIERSNLKPRLDQDTAFNTFTVAGSWTISGNTATFTPAENIVTNSKYTLKIKQGLTSSAGSTLTDEVSYTFTSKYTPFYVDLLSIKARILGQADIFPDDYINYVIFITSLEANAKFYGQMTVSNTPLYESLTEGIVRDQPNLKSHGVSKWTEAVVVHKILNAILIDHITSVGRTRELGDYRESLTKDFVDGLKTALKSVEQEINTWEDTLAPSDVPGFAAKNSGWSSDSWDYDLSVYGIEGDRI